MSGLERPLNAYESMLATSTCNVAISCLVPIPSQSTDLNETIQEGWRRTIAQRGLLQVALEVGAGGYRTVHVANQEDLPPVQVHKSSCKDNNLSAPGLLKKLQRQGTVDMDVSRSTYVMTAVIQRSQPSSSSTTDEVEEGGRVPVSFFLTLCHALSDGPGTLHVMNDFLRNVHNVIDGEDVVGGSADVHLTIMNLQSRILGPAHGVDTEKGANESFYPGLESFKAAIGAKGEADRKIGDEGFLPPEALQQLPSDCELPAPSEIDALSFSLTKEQTGSLRNTCRAWGGTVQGAVSVSCLLARLMLLATSLPITCALQIPVNSRRLVDADEMECLCGSAGVWHTLHLEETSSIGSLIELASASVREAVAKKQHVEWLRRLMNDPLSLPAYSLMVSSIGVAPFPNFYGLNEHSSVKVLDGVFFGGALANKEQSSSAQATMVHVTTICDALKFTLSFTSPGVAKTGIGTATIHLVEQMLVAIAEQKLSANDPVTAAFDLIRH